MHTCPVHEITLWLFSHSERWWSFSVPVDSWTVAFSPDSKYIATGSHLGKVNIFGVESGKKEHSLDTRGKFILSIAYVRSIMTTECITGYIIKTHFSIIMALISVPLSISLSRVQMESTWPVVLLTELLTSLILQLGNSCIRWKVKIFLHMIHGVFSFSVNIQGVFTRRSVCYSAPRKVC